MAAMPSRQVVITKAAYQSRPNCIVWPSGTPRLDCGEDCSCWMLCRDPACQDAGCEDLDAPSTRNLHLSSATEPPRVYRRKSILNSIFDPRWNLSVHPGLGLAG